MKLLMCALSVLVVVVVVGWVAVPADAQGDESVPSIKKIMATLHKGAKAPLSTVKAALKGESPDWELVRKDAKVIATYGALLSRNEPPRGEPASYQKLARSYVSNAKALVSAAEKEDLKAARDAAKKIGSSCMTCHQAHKGQ